MYKYQLVQVCPLGNTAYQSVGGCPALLHNQQISFVLDEELEEELELAYPEPSEY